MNIKRVEDRAGVDRNPRDDIHSEMVHLARHPYPKRRPQLRVRETRARARVLGRMCGCVCLCTRMRCEERSYARWKRVDDLFVLSLSLSLSVSVCMCVCVCASVRVHVHVHKS